MRTYWVSFLIFIASIAQAQNYTGNKREATDSLRSLSGGNMPIAVVDTLLLRRMLAFDSLAMGEVPFDAEGALVFRGNLGLFLVTKTQHIRLDSTWASYDTTSLSNRINLRQLISDTNTTDATRYWVIQQLYLTSVDSATKFASKYFVVNQGYITSVDSATKFLSISDAVAAYMPLGTTSFSSLTVNPGLTSIQGNAEFLAQMDFTSATSILFSQTNSTLHVGSGNALTGIADVAVGSLLRSRGTVGAPPDWSDSVYILKGININGKFALYDNGYLYKYANAAPGNNYFFAGNGTRADFFTAATARGMMGLGTAATTAATDYLSSSLSSVQYVGFGLQLMNDPNGEGGIQSDATLDNYWSIYLYDDTVIGQVEAVRFYNSSSTNNNEYTQFIKPLEFTTLRTALASAADAGVIRLANAEKISWEASPASTDIDFYVNSSENFVLGNLTIANPGSAITMTVPTTSFTVARTDAANTFTGVQTMTSPALTTPTIGVATGTSLAVTGLITSSSSSAGIGYATGAGGTVTQNTNKTTGVTLSKTTGTITMNNAALAAGAEAVFTVTNTTVAATDIPVVAIKSGGTTGSYLVSVSAVGSGTFDITISNVSAGSLSEAVVLSFAIIKGVAS